MTDYVIRLSLAEVIGWSCVVSAVLCAIARGGDATGAAIAAAVRRHRAHRAAVRQHRAPRLPRPRLAAAVLAARLTYYRIHGGTR